MSWIFSVSDPDGRLVRLSTVRWKHIASRHPQLADRLEDVKQAITRPASVVPQRFDPAKRNHYRFLRDSHCFLLVVVKYINGEGHVITAFMTRHTRKR